MAARPPCDYCEWQPVFTDASDEPAEYVCTEVSALCPLHGLSAQLPPDEQDPGPSFAEHGIEAVGHIDLLVGRNDDGDMVTGFEVEGLDDMQVIGLLRVTQQRFEQKIADGWMPGPA